MWSPLFARHISKRTSTSSPTWDHISGVGLTDSTEWIILHRMWIYILNCFRSTQYFYIPLKKTSNYVMSELQYAKQWTVKQHDYALNHTKHWFSGSHVDVQQICGVAVNPEFCNCAVYCATNVKCCLVDENSFFSVFVFNNLFDDLKYMWNWSHWNSVTLDYQ